ncbi:hypothetical protein PV11_03959 [Exophiala sideris]|uniref:Fibroin-3 related protein n=1 Tax=Exophiala sideris TaxID=1016849 RepID=A0A0D1VZE2_9EURO|nr:hypothetical protein PV11_03959 [Exophiala sideris]
MGYHLLLRDIASDVDSAKSTFSSWDKCMEKAYCKWPAIVGIVVGSLILLSLIWCFARCLCCGAELCSCCCRCCPSGRRRERPSKFQDDYSRMQPAPYGGYQPTPAPMAYGNPNVPRFATFDDPSTKGNPDSLPPMPSWDTATNRRVEDTNQPVHPGPNGDLEMGRLDGQPQRTRNGYNAVPNGTLSPTSSRPQGDPFANTGMTHAYNGDLGAQTMSQNGTGYENFRQVPLSPPPMYHSMSNTPSIQSDRFMTGAPSPGQAPYNQQRHNPYSSQPPQQQPYPSNSPTRYASSNMSTRYEAPTDYASSRISMPSMPEPQYAQPQAQAPYSSEPPSFLQPGRKPIGGSVREI